MGLRIVAIVPAAGIGRRLGPGTNKTFHTILGKPLIVWTLEALERAEEIREIIPLFKEADMAYGAQCVEDYGISKVRRIGPGGKERQDSVFKGLRMADGSADIIVVHDGVRPLLEPAVLGRAIEALRDCDGVVAAVPVKDTVKEVEGGAVCRTLVREKLWAVQTPQIFRYETIMKAYATAMSDGYYGTDDSGLVERAGGTVRVALGSYENIKVTTPEDIVIAECLFRARGESG